MNVAEFEHAPLWKPSRLSDQLSHTFLSFYVEILIRLLQFIYVVSNLPTFIYEVCTKHKNSYPRQSSVSSRFTLSFFITRGQSEMHVFKQKALQQSSGRDKMVHISLDKSIKDLSVMRVSVISRSFQCKFEVSRCLERYVNI